MQGNFTRQGENTGKGKMEAVIKSFLPVLKRQVVDVQEIKGTTERPIMLCFISEVQLVGLCGFI